MNNDDPPPATLSVIEKLKTAYKLWQEYLKRFPKTSKYTLGEKIDTLFIQTLEHIVIASLLSKERKLDSLEEASTQLELLKFFLQISWELSALQTKPFGILSEQLAEIGRMIGGWRRGIESKTLARTYRRENLE